jgi:hypothetical protein
VHGRPRHLIALFISIVALLAVGAGAAQASPAGDDDTPYGTQGTAFTGIADFPITKPVTVQDPTDKSSVTAVITDGEGDPVLRLTRYDTSGHLTGLDGGTGKASVGEFPPVDDLLDIRVLSNGNIVVVGRGGNEDMVVWVFDSAGNQIHFNNYDLPQNCFTDEEGTSTDLSTKSDRVRLEYDGDVVDAARVRADGGVYALWDCDEQSDNAYDFSTQEVGDHHSVLVTYASDAGAEGNNLDVPYQYGEDVEIGPDGRPYTLGLDNDNEDPESSVYRADTGVTGLDEPTDGSDLIDGYPVDLAVDSAGRPVVWTVPNDDGSTTWDITRLVNSDLTIDGTWGDGGTKELTDSRQGDVYGGQSVGERDDSFLTIRPGDKVLVTGTDENDGDPLGDLIIGLTNQGQVDTSWSDNGYKAFTLENLGSSDTQDFFLRIGEPKLQSDGKVLVPSTVRTNDVVDSARVGNRIAHPTEGDTYSLGVTRLNPDPTVPPANRPVRPITTSSVPAICGRRAISLVRADVKGKKVKLTGLVGSKLYGKKVTIQTNYGAKSSAFTKSGTVTASAKTGTFTATVARPSAKEFKSARFRAVSGSAKSPKLKLPQSLTSRSVKSAKGTITVTGHVKKSVLGKRNKVVIRRLACGRYRTVGSARPDKNGKYTITFKATALRGVSFYRAEAIVQVRPGSKKYAIQYARAIAIRTTSQTG